MLARYRRALRGLAGVFLIAAVCGSILAETYYRGEFHGDGSGAWYGSFDIGSGAAGTFILDLTKSDSVLTRGVVIQNRHSAGLVIRLGAAAQSEVSTPSSVASTAAGILIPAYGVLEISPEDWRGRRIGGRGQTTTAPAAVFWTQ